MSKQKVPDSSFGRTFKAKLLFSKVSSSVAVPKSKVVFYMEHATFIASYFSLFWQWTNQNGRLNVYHNCAPIRTLGRWLVIYIKINNPPVSKIGLFLGILRKSAF